MGQGNSSITLPAGPSTIETSELSDLTYEKSLGGARFLRSVRARHLNGVVVAKVCTKIDPKVSFQKYAQALKQERKLLRDIPNVLPYARIRETSTIGVLVRQFIHTSLYDRISIRPFLEDIEKKWIAYQLLCAVKDCHDRGVYHGDIKSENVLVTSWGWVYLTDFASSFKPVYLPEDNPADFTFYYDTSGRRICNLAPERFFMPGERPQEGDLVQWNMDVFSLGCVLAELFTETPTFTLSQMYRYKRGEYDPTVALLNKIDDDHVRSMITSMIKLDPSDRWHANDYLEEYKEKVFPGYFYNHFHTLLQEITDPSSGRKAVTPSDVNSGEADDRIDRIYEDFEMLSASLGYQDAKPPELTAPQPTRVRGLFPLQIDLPNSRHAAHAADISAAENGTFILLNVIAASMRSSARAATKLRACELLLAFAEHLPDEAKLDRILPYIMPLLEDPNEMVLAAVLRTMTQLLALVKVVSPVNSYLFTQYIFPKLQSFVKSKGFAQNALVRATYAACLASLAETASRFLDVMQALRAEGTLSSGGRDDLGAENIANAEAFDSTRTDMLDQFEAQTKVFLTDTDNAVRRAFLTSVSSLCVFFGEARSADVILSHLNTYLNDQDWLLKCAFFKTIVGIAVYIGGANVENFVLPLMLQALTDPQEFVVEQALRSLATMAEIGLLQRAKTWELIDTVARFEMHPNIWIKEAASHFISAATTYLSLADVRILVAPLIQPYLKVPIATLSESELLDALKKPLPRTVLDLAAQWAGKVERSAFWKTARESKQLSYSATGQMPPQSSVADLGPKALAKVPKTDEDEQWLGRLRNAGMKLEDEMKILAFREYLWRSAQRSKRCDSDEKEAIFDQMVSLSGLKIQPQTVIFDTNLTAYEQRVEKQNRTIAEAIEEASKVEARRTNNTESSSVEASGVDGPSQPAIAIPEATRRLSGLRHNKSDSLSSSPNSGIGLLGNVDQALRQKGNAAGLLGGTGKAQPAVATNEAVAQGKLDRPRSESRKPSPVPGQVDRRKALARTSSQRPGHNYTGNDPTVLKLLDAVYVDNFPIDVADFGPFVQPVNTVIPTNVNHATSGPWRPQGRLVAALGEHTAKVTHIAVSPDHVFFLTASDDGSVKVWDSSRLERNVTYRSRQSYKLEPGVTITGLCFIEATHSFVCTGSDGSVHVVRVDVVESQDKGTRYGKLRIIRDWQIPTTSPAGEHAVCSEHFRGESVSTLVLVTNLGRILAVDLRYMSIIFDLQNPAHHGTPTSLCMGRKHDWLLVGTTLGVLDLWDMRFHCRLRSWTFANAAPITCLQLHPSRRSSKRNRFCVTGGTAPGEISVWDAEKGICLEVIRPSFPGMEEKSNIRNYELKNMDDEKAEGLLGRVGGTESTNDPVLHTVTYIGAQPSAKDPETQHSYAITGGPDGKVRFWDTDRLEGCRLVSGGTPDEKPVYTFSQLGMDCRVLSEKVPDAAGVSASVTSPAKKPGPSAGNGKPANRYETIRLASQNLISGHLDMITAVRMLERPFGMVLSADRKGMVYVYQ
ncbi:Putative serine/threonine-protein kinase Vps15 [Septoria linicola]|uniref:non-specific serine/threonine protein kinase n=1 Tax=Septoria linicola TaxID=215465 RepID=A0A9Q9EP91_9PEZI|nr:putative serine/threonine-protein kinase Vps15 [Septoria linicola]USW57419.1 Putative serine/threonine-protein kinase Vps15 [Septoria linicola]